MNDIDAVKDMLNRIAGQMPIMERMLIELAAQVALQQPDPHGYLERMVERSEKDARAGYSVPGTQDALRYSLEFISLLRTEFAQLEK